jgi:glycosyltransferase involved in cell wall biosynthesis
MMYPNLAISGQLSTIGKQARVAWLFPMMLRTHYWQPVFREFALLVPNTMVFVGRWGGFARGYEGTFSLKVIDGVRIVELESNKANEHYTSSFCWAPLSILKELARFRPNVIFTTGFNAWTMCAIAYKLIARSSVIVLWDGCSANSNSQVSITRALQRRLIAPFIDFGVSNMRQGSDYLRQALGMPQNKVLSYPYQVADMEILGSSPSSGSFPINSRPIFLFVGAICSRKGWSYLIEAARLLVRQGIDQFSVIFVGAGDQEQKLRATITDYGLSHVAFCAGPVPYHKMASCYREADVFIFPTMDDVWGLVLIEAMTFGKPVICSKFAGAREMMVHDDNGFIVDPRNIEALAGYMRRFIQDQSLLSKFGLRSRQLIAPFTPQRSAQVLATVALQTYRGEASAVMPEAHSPQGVC